MKQMTTAKGTVLPLLDMRGKPYLQVAHRLVWVREEHPNWRIETTIYSGNDAYTICKATILDENGHTLATAHKREDKEHFSDHMEKSETGAIGRALALCGYGTQFAPELDEGQRLADSPITPAKKQVRLAPISVAPPMHTQDDDIPFGMDDLPPPTSENPAPQSTALDGIIPFGRDSGKRFSEFPMDEHKKNLAFWAQKLNGEQPKGKLANYLRELEMWVSG